MRSGKLRSKATIYIPTSDTNEWGEVEKGYIILGTYACSAVTKPRREYEQSDSVVSKTEYDLRFRYYPELSTLPRNAYVVVKGLTLEISALANVMLIDREIQMICEERS